MTLHSRRSLILGAGAALIARPARALIVSRNPLAYPGGRNAAFDPTHFAAGGPNIRYSAIPGQNALINQLTGVKTGLSSAAITTPVTNYGPGALYSGLGSYSTVANAFSETPSFMTIAGIVTINSSTGFAAIFGGTGGATSTNVLYIVSLASIRFNGASTAANSGIGVTIGHTYFIAVSATATTKYFSVLDLTTGQLKTATIANATGFAASATPWSIGGTSANTLGGYIHAVMYSVGFVPLPQLVAWAKAPWDFWYPPRRENLMFSGLGNVQPASAGSAQMPLFGVGP